MATLLLTAVGTLVGGPVGGAIGALAGRAIDGAIVGGGTREGPRLKELALTSSSYGTPIARHHGRMRAAGSVIWATDLVEHSETGGGGKGKPKTTRYSYSISFAVALASRPIARIGRIWADGNLLRGSAGDLKCPGIVRVHTGHGDQQPDPLIASAEGDCPAFRHLAYAVFEDLALADFGNRIPALTFEIIADDGTIALADLVDPRRIEADTAMRLDGLAGYSNEGGPLRDLLGTIDAVYPLACDASGASLTLSDASAPGSEPILLPEPASGWEPGDFGEVDGRSRRRDAEAGRRPDGLRYYDVARDFQPGLQRAAGRAQGGRERTIEFPGALAADTARTLVAAAAQRAGWRRETLSWRSAELDPAIVPGATARAPGLAGLWRVAAWEWRERGVELELVRLPPVGGAVMPGDAGRPALPADLEPAATLLQAFALPWDGFGSPDNPMLFAAASATGPNWTGATLYLDDNGQLVPLGPTGRRRSVVGTTTGTLAPSLALRLDRAAQLEIQLAGDDLSFAPSNVAGLAAGANRLLVGDEVIQFARAEQIGARVWRLSGLLRGRGGTEAAARQAHPAGTRVVLVDESLVPLDPAIVPAASTTTLAALGFGDEEPVLAPLANPQAGRKPPCPVHPRATAAADGGLVLRWTRRARGAWTWSGDVEVPLVEQSETYRVGCGSVDAPVALWTTGEPALAIAPARLAELAAGAPGAPLWVRQVGSHALSDPLLLTTL